VRQGVTRAVGAQPPRPMLHTFNPVSRAARRRPAKTRRRTAGGAHGWGDGWAGKGGALPAGRTSIPPRGSRGRPPHTLSGGHPPVAPRGSERKRIPIQRQRMSTGVAGLTPRCAARTPEDGILGPHCKRFGVAVAAGLLISFAKRPASLPKGLAQRHIVSQAVREMPA
jgi:hypothetical protein